ncbi:C-type mannose receptor 2-like [Engraulis encrasicolus]|uniref:C-type mannose receptor 2-like n=1 Tax=Engraulis encrasicolus TaxID=184585 RepID=UPI002FD79167
MAHGWCVLLLTLGVCGLSSSVPRQFYVVNEWKNWAEAQQYCRREYTDLATIDNMAELEAIKRPSSTQPYVLVEEEKTWADAQRYCRENHRDLATIRNEAENKKIKDLIRGKGNVYRWIGLFRDAWEWSDGSSSSFRHWDSGQPSFDSSSNGLCVEIRSSGLWNDEPCDSQRYFVCYEDKLVLVRENKTWMEAMQYCREHHVDLVSVTSEKIQRWVEGWAKGASSPHVWLGLRYSCTFGFWFWVSGYSVCYDNFASDADRMPGCDIAGGAVDKHGGQWVSLQETQQLNFICTNEEC